MKAKEAPEEIYLATTKEIQNLDTSFVGVAHSNPEDIVEPIEYVLKDAFIEKACEWLKSKGGFTIGFPGAEIKDFKNYMQNESR